MILDDAITLHGLGLSLIPIAADSKRPTIKWKKFQTERCTEGDLRRWFRGGHRHDIGIVTGKISGIVAVDADDVESCECVETNCEPTEIRNRTTRGMHFLFRHPGKKIPNTTGLCNRKIDIRGDGGYVRFREPVGGMDIWKTEWGGMPTYDPAWLGQSVNPPEPCDVPPSNGARHPLTIKATEYLAYGCQENGKRNSTLYGVACDFQASAWPIDDALERLVPVAMSGGLERGEAEETIRSAFKADRTPTAFPDTDIPPVEPCQPGKIELTETGNGQRFAKQHGRDLRYVCIKDKGYWLVWDGRRWKEDCERKVDRRAKATTASISAEAEKCADDDPGKTKLHHWWYASRRKQAMRSMIDLARSEPGIPISPTDLDGDPFLMNVANGTIDLRTGELREHRREDLLTKLAPVEYDPDAKSPTWSAFLHRIMGGDTGLIEFLQRAVGVSITGDIREQVIFIMYGGGANGKSTFADTILGMMGDYAAIAPPDLLTVRRNEEHPTEIADLLGKRLVLASETEESRRLRIGFVKQSTGDKTLKARRMREDYFEFPRTHKTWLQTNNRPAVRESSLAIWRRIRLIPFTVTIPEAQQDKALLEKLVAEWPGILAWAVRGCLTWQEEGLPDVAAIKTATDEYRDEEDVLTPFLEDRCVADSDRRIGRAEIWAAYTDWAKDAGERYPLQRKGLYERLRKRGFADVRYRDNEAGVRGFNGIGLRSSG